MENFIKESGLPPERIKELVQAEMEGRVVTGDLKPGSRVFSYAEHQEDGRLGEYVVAGYAPELHLIRANDPQWHLWLSAMDNRVFANREDAFNSYAENRESYI